jgi:predicted Zn finger-like uncharacterized protein
MQFACTQCNARFQIADAKVGPRGVKVPCKRCGHTIIVRRGAGAEAVPDVPIFSLPPSLAHLAQAGAAAPAPDEGESTQVLDNPLAQQAAEEAAAAAAVVSSAQSEEERTSVEVRPSAQPSVPSPDPAEVLRAAAAAELAAASVSPSQALGLGDDLDEGRQSTRVMTGLESEQLVSASAQEEAPPSEPASPAPSTPSPAPGAAPAVDWYVGIDDQQVGPLRVDQLAEKWQAGAVGPDTLCWRAGMDDWLPVSRVAELASVLAPRPPPAVVAAPPAPSPGASRVTGSFASMASTGAYEPLGATTGSHRPFTEGPAAAAVPAPVAVTVAPPVDTGGWRPSAASALASLVQEEMAVLSRPQPPAPAPTGPTDAFGFGEGTPHAGVKLDVPLAEARPSQVYGSADVDPFAATSPGFAYKAGAQPAPARAPLPASGWVPPGAPVAAPPALPPPAPSRNPTVLVFGVLGVAILAALGVIVWLLLRQQAPAAAGAELAAAAVPAVRPVEPPAAPAVAAKPAPLAPPAPKVEPEPVAEAKAEAPAEQPSPAPARGEPKPAPRAEKPAPEKKVAEKPAEPKVEKKAVEKPAERPVEEKVVAAPPPPPREEKRPAAKAPAVADDDFDSIFGAPKKKEAAAPAEDKAAKKTVYVPPPPAASADPEKLGQADINAVVVANKAAIKGCVDEQKQKDPTLQGKLVMRWTIQTSGKVTGVGCQTDPFKDSAMAACLSRLIKGLQFPRHRVQGEPVNFTFKF